MSQKIEQNDTVEIINNLSKEVLALPTPRLGIVTNANGAYITVVPNGLSYKIEYLENEVKLHAKTNKESVLKDIKNHTWRVENNIATAVNPHPKPDESDFYRRNELVGMNYGDFMNKVRSEFDKSMQQISFETDAPNGNYAGSEFANEVWQYDDGGRGWYDEMTGPAYEGEDYEPESTFEGFTKSWSAVYRTRRFRKWLSNEANPPVNELNEKFRAEAKINAKQLSFISFADIEEKADKREAYEYGFEDGAFLAYNALSKQSEQSLAEKDKELQELREKVKLNEWTLVSASMPPFDKLIELRGIINWRSENSVSYFSDIVENDYEQLEYGISGYLLKEHNDYYVVNHPNPDEVCSEYITHWRYLTEPVI